MNAVFWTAFAVICYCYFGYPALIWLMARLRPRRVWRADIQPTVSVILSVWNEEDVIEAKIRNLLSWDYPPGKIEFLVGSDNSTDGTDGIIRKFTDPRLRYIASPRRRGKMLTLNDLVAAARNEVLVFTDARQIFEKNAVSQLVKNFADPSVGCVSGELVFSDRKEGGTAKGVGLYWTYEKFIRDNESRVHSMLGATGAIYAIRRELYVPLPADIVLDDLYIPFGIIRKNYRAVFDGSARAHDRAAEDPREEYRRKVRTLYGNYQIFTFLPEMFNPIKSPVAVQLFSHKFLRLMVPFLMFLLFLANIFLLEKLFYRTIFGLQTVFYALAAGQWLMAGKNFAMPKILARITYVPYVFCLLNVAALAGFRRFLTRGQPVTWEKARVR